MTRPARRGAAALIAALLVLAGCQAVPPEAALVAAQPRTDPARPGTPYSDALGCLRDQLAAAPGPVSTVTIGTVPDATGRITPGLRDMVASAIADIAGGRSRFNLIEIANRAEGFGLATGIRPDLGGALIGISNIRQMAGYQLIGALTQADRANQSRGLDGGVSVNGSEGGVGLTDDFSTVALDLRLVDISGGLSVVHATRNLLAVRNTGFAIRAGVTIGSVGTSLDYSFDRREGAHQAVRTLVELSVAELLGRTAQVPYWTCLSVDRNHPTIRAQIARWYRAMSEEELDRDVRQRLRAAGVAVPEAPEPATAAITAFQAANNLVPNGRPTFETYATLVGRHLPRGASAGELPREAPR